MLRVVSQMTGLAGAPYFSTQYFEGSTSGEAAIAVEAVFDFWTAIKGFITAGLSIQIQPEVDVLDVPTGQVQDTFAASAVPVVSTGNAPLPKATQGLLRARTSEFVAGRRVQGRVFIPALANDAQLGGVPSSGFMTALATAGAALVTDTNPGQAWSIWHRPSSVGASDGSLHPVTSTSVWNQFAVLRSRRD